MGFFVKIEFDVSDKLYPRANSPASLRPIECFALERARFVCDRATRIESENLRSVHSPRARILINALSNGLRVLAAVRLGRSRGL